MLLNLETFYRLNQRTRILLMALVCVVVVGISFQLIGDGPLDDLKASQAQLENLKDLAMDMGTSEQALKIQADLLQDTTEVLNGLKRQCFTANQATSFIEQVNVWAKEYHCTPISRVVDTASKSSSKQVMTSAQPITMRMVMQGHFKDLIAFMKRLYDRPQKVVVTDCHIGLPPGENLFPRASFRVVLFVSDMKDEMIKNQEP